MSAADYDYAGGKQADPFDGMDVEVKRGIDGVTACLAGRRAEARQILLLALCALYRGERTSPSFDDTIPDPEYRDLLLGLLRILVDRIRDSERVLNLEYQVEEAAKPLEEKSRSVFLALVKTKASTFYDQYIEPDRSSKESKQALPAPAPAPAPPPPEPSTEPITSGICRSKLMLLHTRQLQAYIGETMKDEEERQEEYDLFESSLDRLPIQLTYEGSTFDETVGWTRIAELGMPPGDETDSDSSDSVETTVVSGDKSCDELIEQTGTVKDKDRQVMCHKKIAELKKAQRRQQKKEKREIHLMSRRHEKEQKPKEAKCKPDDKTAPEKGKEKIRIVKEATPKTAAVKRSSLKRLSTFSVAAVSTASRQKEKGKLKRNISWNDKTSITTNNRSKSRLSVSKIRESRRKQQKSLEKLPSSSTAAKLLTSLGKSSDKSSESSTQSKDSKASINKKLNDVKKQLSSSNARFSEEGKKQKGNPSTPQQKTDCDRSEDMAPEMRKNRSQYILNTQPRK